MGSGQRLLIAREPAVKALERTGLKPLELRAKEGLSLLNGT